MSLPPYPSDDWGRGRVGVVLFVLLGALAARLGEQKPAARPRPPVVVVERDEAPAPWVGCCKVRIEL